VSVLERNGVTVTQGPRDRLTVRRLEPPPPVLEALIVQAVLSRDMVEWLCEKFPDIPIEEFYNERIVVN
jgi:hypothetical protein